MHRVASRSSLSYQISIRLHLVIKGEGSGVSAGGVFHFPRSRPIDRWCAGDVCVQKRGIKKPPLSQHGSRNRRS